MEVTSLYSYRMRSKLPKHAILVPKNAVKVFEGIIYDSYQWPQTLFDGRIETFEMLKRPDTVKVIAVRGDKVVILEQEQPGQRLFYDIPGGMHDHEEEDEEQAIKRELLEETGLTFNYWRLLSVVQPHGKIEQFVYTFLASDFESEQEQRLDAGEKIEVVYMDFAEAKQALMSDKGRYLPKEFEIAQSLDDLLALPEYL